MAEEVFSNDAQTVVNSGGTSAPAGGTSEAWTVASPGAFPAAASTASRPTTFHVADTAFPTEVIAVTNTSGAIWTVTRGAEGSTPVAHSPGFSVKQAITAGVLATLRDAAAGSTSRPNSSPQVAPGAVGWLGSTSGVTDDGRLIALARFESDRGGAAEQ